MWEPCTFKLKIMNELQIIDNSIAIKETIGFKFLDGIDVIDIPNVIKFCNIVYNYMKMSEVISK